MWHNYPLEHFMEFKWLDSSSDNAFYVQSHFSYPDRPMASNMGTFRTKMGPYQIQPVQKCSWASVKHITKVNSSLCSFLTCGLWKNLWDQSWKIPIMNNVVYKWRSLWLVIISLGLLVSFLLPCPSSLRSCFDTSVIGASLMNWLCECI